jgi:hypothetical protein
LADWFIRLDGAGNGDGQVEMWEYSKSWDNATAARFASYDLNGDGVITAEECLKKEPPKR